MDTFIQIHEWNSFSKGFFFLVSFNPIKRIQELNSLKMIAIDILTIEQNIRKQKLILELLYLSTFADLQNENRK